MNAPVHAKVFWSGGSQAVRLPKQFRVEGAEVVVRRKGRTLVLEPLPEDDDWEGFWESLKPLNPSFKRWPQGRAQKRRLF